MEEKHRPSCATLKKEKKVKEYYGRWGTLAVMRETAEERIVSKIRVGITKKKVQVERKYESHQ